MLYARTKTFFWKKNKTTTTTKKKKRERERERETGPKAQGNFPLCQGTEEGLNKSMATSCTFCKPWTLNSI